MSRFFAYSCDGFTFHDTAEAAKVEAERMLDIERDFATREGEWGEDANQIMWGEVRGRVEEQFIESDNGEESVEMTLEDLQ